MTKDEIQAKALESTENKIRCSVVLGTGVGKTLVCLNHMNKNSTGLMRI